MFSNYLKCFVLRFVTITLCTLTVCKASVKPIDADISHKMNQLSFLIKEVEQKGIDVEREKMTLHTAGIF